MRQLGPARAEMSLDATGAGTALCANSISAPTCFSVAVITTSPWPTVGPVVLNLGDYWGVGSVPRRLLARARACRLLAPSTPLERSYEGLTGPRRAKNGSRYHQRTLPTVLFPSLVGWYEVRTKTLP